MSTILQYTHYFELDILGHEIRGKAWNERDVKVEGTGLVII